MRTDCFLAVHGVTDALAEKLFNNLKHHFKKFTIYDVKKKCHNI